MKQFTNKYLHRFNQLVFGLLMVLFVSLVSITVFSSFNELNNAFSLEDFENELMGQAYFASLNGNYEAEIQLYKQVVEKMPEREAELFFKIGKASFSEGKYKEAVNYYNHSLEAGVKDSSEVFFHVALTAQKLNNYKVANKYYHLAVNHPKYSKEAFFNLANIYFFEIKDEEKALAYYKKSIEEQSVENEYENMILRELEVYPAWKDSSINQFLLSELKYPGKEIDFNCFDQTAFQKNRPNKTQAVIRNYIGIIEAKNNNKIAAISQFQKAMEIDPEFKDARFNFQKLVSEVKNK